MVISIPEHTLLARPMQLGEADLRSISEMIGKVCYLCTGASAAGAHRRNDHLIELSLADSHPLAPILVDVLPRLWQ